MDNYQYERAVVEVLTEIIESRGLKHDAVAKKAWGRAGAGRSWQSMRNDSPPTKLTIRDAYAMAKELSVNMSAICGMVEGKAIQGEIKASAAAPTQEKKEATQAETTSQPRPAPASNLPMDTSA